MGFDKLVTYQTFVKYFLAFNPRKDKQLSVAFLKSADRERNLGKEEAHIQIAKHVDAKSNLKRTEVAVKTLKGMKLFEFLCMINIKS